MAPQADEALLVLDGVRDGLRHPLENLIKKNKNKKGYVGAGGV